MRRASPLLWLTALVVVAYADIIFAGRGLFLQDITTYHYPMKHVVRDVIARGEFPYWNRYWSAGQPLAANPAYEVFYPLQWLIFLPGFHLGLQLHILAHFLIAGIGACRLARSLGCGPRSATFAGISFAFCGPVLSLSTKLPILFSLAWMPWSLDFGRRFLLRRDRGSFAGAALTLAMQAIVAEPTVLMQTAALLGGYAIFIRRSIRDLGFVAAMGFAGAAVAAVQLIPAADFARDSVRSEAFPFAIVSNWSTPPARALELIVPKFFEHVKDDQGRQLIATMYPYRIEGFLPSFYLGIGVLLLATAGVLTRMRGWGVMLLTAGAFGVIAAGERTPLLRVLYDTGVFRAVRFPEKFVLAPALILIVWAALVLERGERRGLTIAAIGAAVIALLTILPQPHVEPRWLVVDVLVRIAVVAVALSRPKWASAAVVLMTLDVWSATRDLVPRMPRAFFDPPPVAKQLPQSGRIYSEAAWDWWDQKPISYAYFGGKTVEQYWWNLRNGAFPNVPVYWGREIALEDDVDRTSLLNTDALREQLKRMRARGFGGEEPLLHVSNVTALLRFRAIEGQSDMPVEVIPVADSPRYFFEPKEAGDVTASSETDNAIHLQARATAKADLVLSVTAHRYWSATVDGKHVDLQPAHIAYQSIALGPGLHTIELRYRNPLFVWSGAISLLALAAVITALAWRPRATAG